MLSHHQLDPLRSARVVFTQGDLWKEGGWFDSSASKPCVQIQRAKNGAWESVGELADYPATTTTDKANLRSGLKFTVRLPSSVQIFAIRILGKPASGENPKQAFVACSELEAFAD